MDAAVGRILAGLRDAGLDENTWVIFTNDHGAAMPRAKGTLCDPGIEVTLLTRWPAQGIAGGRVAPELLSNVDMVPTILAGLGCCFRAICTAAASGRCWRARTTGRAG